MIETPRRRPVAFLVPLLIAINIGVFFLWSTGGMARADFMQQNFLISWEALQEGRWWTLLTAVFSHSLFLHLLFNMMVLWSFGQILEEILGPKKFIVFYLISGIISSLSHAAVSTLILGHPNMAALGASGAVAGVLLLFCLLFPRQKILLFGLIPLPAMVGAIAFIGLDVWGVVAQAQGGGLPIGHGAHLGGAFCGLVYYFTALKRKTPSRFQNHEGVL